MIDGLYPTCPVEEIRPQPSGEILVDEQQNWKNKFDDKKELLEAVYIQSCYCSLGAALVAEARPDFDDYMKKTSGLMMVEDTIEKLATIRKEK